MTRGLVIAGVGRVDEDALDAAEPLDMDEDAFRTFYDLTSSAVWAYLSHITGDSHAADDLLQETYIRFLGVRRRWESDAHRRNYLFRIATNLAHDCHRRDKIRQTEPLDESAHRGGRAVVVRRSRLRAARRPAPRARPVVAARTADAVAGLRRRVVAPGNRRHARPQGRRHPRAAVPRAPQAGGAPRSAGEVRRECHEARVRAGGGGAGGDDCRPRAGALERGAAAARGRVRVVPRDGDGGERASRRTRPRAPHHDGPVGRTRVVARAAAAASACRAQGDRTGDRRPRRRHRRRRRAGRRARDERGAVCGNAVAVRLGAAGAVVGRGVANRSRPSSRCSATA